MTRPTVAFVDDDPDVLRGLRRSLRALHGRWAIAYHDDPARALEALRTDPVDVAVVDIRMPGLDGITLAATLAADCPGTRTIVLSGSTDFDVARSSINVGRVFRYLVKPCPTPDLVAAVEAALLDRAHDRQDDREGDRRRAAPVAIERRAHGIVVLDPEGRVRAANPRGEALLARRDGLVVDPAGACRAVRAADTEVLHRAIRAAREAGTAEALTVQTDRHGPLRIVARPADGAADGDGPGVALHLFAADDEPTVDPHLLRGLFGLTDSESRLAAALASGRSLEDAAGAEGWTLNSAKTYLKAVFQKVGVSRQAELVRVVLRNTGG